MYLIPVKMEPVAGDVNSHGELEHEHPRRVEIAQYHQKTHSGATVGQLVQHGSKFGTYHEISKNDLRIKR